MQLIGMKSGVLDWIKGGLVMLGFSQIETTVKHFAKNGQNELSVPV